MVATTVREIHNWTPDAFARAEERVAAPDGLSSREPVPSAARGLEEGFCLRCGMKARACPSCGDLSCWCKRSMGEGMRQHYETDGSPRRSRFALPETPATDPAPVLLLRLVATVGGRVVVDRTEELPVVIEDFGDTFTSRETLDRAVLLLRRAGYKAREISQRFGISDSTVFRAVTRARHVEATR